VNLDTLKVECVCEIEGGPQNRENSRAVALSKHIIVLGGNSSKCNFNDAWILVLKEAFKSRVNLLPEFYRLPFELIEGQGEKCSPADSNSAQLKWIEIKTKGAEPSPRTGHCMSLINDTLFIFGGSDNEVALV